MNLNDLQTWHYGAIAGGVLLLVGLVVYFLPAGKLKVPGGVVAALGGLACGLALGIIWMAGFGYKPTTPDGDQPAADGGGEAKGKGGPPAPPPGPGMGKGGFGGGAPKGKGGFGGGAPGPRAQLVGLINALDTLVDKPVSLALTADDKAAIAAQLRGLDAVAEVKDDDARARVEALLKVLEKNRPALEAVGFRWPNPDGKGPAKGGFGPPPKDAPNPFAGGDPKEKLQSLQQRLEKK